MVKPSEFEAEVLEPDVVRHFIAPAIKVGDHVRLDLVTYGNFGMNEDHHGRWVRITKVERRETTGFDPDNQFHLYQFEAKSVYPRDPRFPEYVFYEAYIDGWRRPRPGVLTQTLKIWVNAIAKREV